MEFYAIDRIEDQIVVLESPDGSMVALSLSELPDGVAEGDLLLKTEAGFVLDVAATQQRRKELFDLQKSLFDNK